VLERKEKKVNKPRLYGEKVIPPQLTPEEEEEFYFRETDHNFMVVSLDLFQKDVICSKCGLWKTEHRWEICKEPNWL
jgi:hypothetical protein